MVWSYEVARQFSAVFLDALHEDVAPLDSHPDGIEAAYLPHSLRQGAPLPDGLGNGKILQLVVDKGDVVVGCRLVEFDECLRERGALEDMLRYADG